MQCTNRIKTLNNCLHYEKGTVFDRNVALWGNQLSLFASKHPRAAARSHFLSEKLYQKKNTILKWLQSFLIYYYVLENVFYRFICTWNASTYMSVLPTNNLMITLECLPNQCSYISHMNHLPKPVLCTVLGLTHYKSNAFRNYDLFY